MRGATPKLTDPARGGTALVVACIKPGDVIVRVGDVEVLNGSYEEVIEALKNSGETVSMVVCDGDVLDASLNAADSSVLDSTLDASGLNDSQQQESAMEKIAVKLPLGVYTTKGISGTGEYRMYIDKVDDEDGNGVRQPQSRSCGVRVRRVDGARRLVGEFARDFDAMHHGGTIRALTTGLILSPGKSGPAAWPPCAVRQRSAHERDVERDLERRHGRPSPDRPDGPPRLAELHVRLVRRLSVCSGRWWW